MSEILDRMIAAVPEEYDTREGSVLYNALAPCAVALADMSAKIDEFLEEAYGETASRPFLEKRAAEVGIYPYPATPAVWVADFDIAVPIGSRFTCNDLFFVVTKVYTGTDAIIYENPYELTCETVGTIGNSFQHNDRLVSVDNIAGLSRAELKSSIQFGEDEEDTEVFRKRYFDQVKYRQNYGNIQDYVNFVKSIGGVGQVKILRDPVDTDMVGVYITDTQNSSYNSNLVEKVQQLVDPNFAGSGTGWVPIGQRARVTYATGMSITFFADIRVISGADLNEIRRKATENFERHFDKLNEEWDSVPWREMPNASQRVYRRDLLDAVLYVEGVLGVENPVIEIGDHEYDLENFASLPLSAGHLADFRGCYLELR